MFSLFKQNKVLCICAGLIILLAAGAVILASPKGSDPDYPDEPEYTDFTQEKEVLVKKLAKLVEDNPNKDYISDSSQTKFVLASPDYCYEADPDSNNSPALSAFATVASILLNDTIPPSALPEITEGNISSGTFSSLANYYSLAFEEVPAMNFNILNYYLDKNYIVLINAAGEEPYSSNGAYLVVFAAYPNAESYLVSSPTNSEYQGTMVTRLEVLSTIKSDFKFYAFSNPSLGDNL